MTEIVANYQHQTLSVEHYTPPAVIEAARVVLGGIELDPASSPLAQTHVKAERFFTKEDDGLAQPWKARSVFLNPPGCPKKYTPSLAPRFWEKLDSAWGKNEVEAAIFVCFSLEQLQQFQNVTPLRPPAHFPFCIPRTRLAFWQELCCAQGPREHTCIRPLQHDKDHKSGAGLSWEDEGERRPGGELGPQTSPTHANAIILVPPPFDSEGMLTRFVTSFSPFGEVVVPERWRMQS